MSGARTGAIGPSSGPKRSKPRTHGTDAYCDKELIAKLPIGRARFYVLKKEGRFRFLELEPQIPGTNTLYSRHLVDRWLTQSRYAPAADRLTKKAS